MHTGGARRLKFGVFTPPIVRPDADPTWAFERMLALTEHLDRIGFAPHFRGSSARQQENFRRIGELRDDWATPVHDARRAVTTELTDAQT